MFGRFFLLFVVLVIPDAGIVAGQVTSVADGSWDQGAVWSGGVLPQPGDSVVIATRVTVQGADPTIAALTITAAGSLEGVAGQNRQLRVDGGLHNSGSITSAGTGDDFRLRASGDVHNGGTLAMRQLIFTGNEDQTLSQSAGAVWAAEVSNSKSGGRLVAASALDFSGVIDLVGSSYRTLLMNDFDLVVSGTGSLIHATVITNGRLVGRTDSTAFARSTSFVGAPTIIEQVRLGPGVSFDSTLVVTGTLTGARSSSSFTASVELQGDIVNTGTVRDQEQGARLSLAISGNLRNEGTWNALETVLEGAVNQTLDLSAGSRWESDFSWEKTGGSAVAVSDQIFGGTTRLDSLVMAGFDLAVAGQGTLSNSTVYEPGTLRSIDGNESFATSTSIVGNPSIVEWLSPGFGMTIAGDLLIEGTLEAARGGNTGTTTTLLVQGALTNRGTVTNGTNGAVLSLRVGGDIQNSGSWTTDGLELVNDGARTVQVAGIDSQVYCGQRFSSQQPGAVLLTGDNAAPDLSVTGERPCAVLFGSTLALSDPPSSSLDNLGSITVTRDAGAGLSNAEFYRARATVGAGTMGFLSVTHLGNQVPNSFGNAIPGWWTLAHSGDSGLRLGSLRLEYDPADLGGTDAGDVIPLFSEDGGSTWDPVDSGVSITRDNGRVTLSNALASGSYLLSTEALSVETPGGLTAHIIGRETVRAGRAPNRFTVQYSNRSNAPSGIAAIVFRAGRHHHITEVIPSGGSDGVIEPDAFMFPLIPEGNSPPDSAAFLFLDALAPLETRSFDVVLTADPEAAGLSDPTISVEIFQTSTPGGNVTEEFTDDPVAAQEEWTALGASWPFNERPVTPYADALLDRAGTTDKRGALIVTMLLRGVAVIAVPTGCVAVGGFRRFMASREQAMESEAPELFRQKVKPKYQLLPSDDSVRAFVRMQLATSFNWICEVIGLSLDPNEKVGPAGAGGERFLASAGRATYTIFFENKAEATAAAYEVTIDDTLSAAFDPASVILDGSSHEGFEFTRDGNHLNWYVRGIDLPPNVNPPEGEGWVRFSVETVPGLPSGTVLENRASIVFDLNEPIITNTFSNTLDFGAPTTTMTPLAAPLPADSITVWWSTEDGPGESGVQSTTLFASVDGGRFEALGVSYSDSMVVAVEPNREYSFYGISQDLVGNVETQRPAIVTTQVVSGVATEDDVLPFVFALESNYPNPFNPKTTIRFSLPEPGQTTLFVYDLTGRLVERLVDAPLQAGPQQVTWDARHVASGVYFYRLMQGERVQTRPMVLLK